MASDGFDQAKADAFGARILGVLNDSFLGLMCSIGHQTGLFDVMAGLPSSTSEGIAQAANLNERYVREWLATMVSGKVINYEPADATYVLPPEHAASITREAGSDNLAFFTSYIALFAEGEQQIIGCFRNGGGVPYSLYPHSLYPRFQGLQAEESALVNDVALIDSILPLAAGLPGRLAAGIRVADIGCGQGHTLNLMARAYPNSQFTGYDLSEDGVIVGRREASEWGLSNSSFEVDDVTTLGLVDHYDLITTFDVIHDLAQPTIVLEKIRQALRPGGAYLMVEYAASSNLEENVDHPLGPALYAISVMYCMSTSLASGGAGLGTLWGEQKARELLAGAGFTGIEVKQMDGDPLHNFFIATKE